VIRMDFSWSVSRLERRKACNDFERPAMTRLRRLPQTRLRILYILDYTDRLYEPENPSDGAAQGLRGFRRGAASTSAAPVASSGSSGTSQHQQFWVPQRCRELLQARGPRRRRWSARPILPVSSWRGDVRHPLRVAGILLKQGLLQ